MAYFILKMTVTEGSRGRKLKLKLWSYWLASTLTSSYHSYRVLHSYILHRNGAAHGGRGPPTPISKQKPAPKICQEDNLMEAILHLRLPLPHVKLKATISCHIVNQDSVMPITLKQLFYLLIQEMPCRLSKDQSLNYGQFRIIAILERRISRAMQRQVVTLRWRLTFLVWTTKQNQIA